MGSARACAIASSSAWPYLADYSKLAQGRFGWWTGLGPDDSLLTTRDISIQEIYSLDWQTQ